MRPLNKGFLYVMCCAVGLNAPVRVFAQSGAEPVQSDPVTLTANADAGRTSSLAQLAAPELPDSPGTGWAKGKEEDDQNSSSSVTQATSSQSGSAQAPPATVQDQKPQRPVGTAAAEAPRSKGVTAAEPSGIAIAPAKQRRVRTIILRVGALAGAGAAIGAVVALAAATPSRPPGAH